VVVRLAAHRTLCRRRRRAGVAGARRGHRPARRPRIGNHARRRLRLGAYHAGAVPSSRIEDDLWIVPTWRTAPNPAAVNIALDPGLAFGTGAHPSTRLCLSWLRHNLAAGCSVLDYGCGSGILAIAAAKLGARVVVGVDIDAQAVAASAANARLNGVDATFLDVDALPGGATFDVVVANILANPLRVLAPALCGRTAAGGSIALAGILVAQADDVAAAYARWFDLRAWRSDDDWVLLAGRRRPATNAGGAP